MQPQCTQTLLSVKGSNLEAYQREVIIIVQSYVTTSVTYGIELTERENNSILTGVLLLGVIALNSYNTENLIRLHV